MHNLTKLRDFLRYTLSQFYEHQVFFGQGSDSAFDEATYLVFGGLNLPWQGDDRLLDASLTEAEKTKLHQLINQRCQARKPLAYLLGEAWYAGLRFKVNEAVLIPRSPIVELIETAFTGLIDENQPPARVLDLCTGSGCIGIATAYAFPTAEVVLTDISPQALAVAEENIALHQLEKRITAIKSDLYAQLNSAEKFDLIVTNPPYVNADDLNTMPAEFSHEPKLALAAGEDGLSLAHEILAKAADYLTEDGLLILEVGNSQAALEAAYPTVPFLWLEFEANAGGVCVLTYQQLKEYF